MDTFQATKRVGILVFTGCIMSGCTFSCLLDRSGINVPAPTVITASPQYFCPNEPVVVSWSVPGYDSTTTCYTGRTTTEDAAVRPMCPLVNYIDPPMYFTDVQPEERFGSRTLTLPGDTTFGINVTIFPPPNTDSAGGVESASTAVYLIDPAHPRDFTFQGGCNQHDPIDLTGLSACATLDQICLTEPPGPGVEIYIWGAVGDPLPTRVEIGPFTSDQLCLDATSLTGTQSLIPRVVNLNPSLPPQDCETAGANQPDIPIEVTFGCGTIGIDCLLSGMGGGGAIEPALTPTPGAAACGSPCTSDVQCAGLGPNPACAGGYCYDAQTCGGGTTGGSDSGGTTGGAVDCSAVGQRCNLDPQFGACPADYTCGGPYDEFNYGTCQRSGCP